MLVLLFLFLEGSKKIFISKSIHVASFHLETCCEKVVVTVYVAQQLVITSNLVELKGPPPPSKRK